MTVTAMMRHLAKQDPVLARIITRPCPFPLYGKADLYADLLQAIVSQQLSVKAADTIFARFLDLFPGRRPAPARLLALRSEKLRAAGVSRQKAGYLKAVARFERDGGLAPGRLRDLDDEQVIEHLTRIRGVGRWTAEMLLMFSLHRPDVFPVDDLGIQQAMRRLYGLSGEGPRFKRRLQTIAEAWRPCRTLACRYLWHWKGLQGSA
jgi:DNA-3-methyladenine glycosylase II